MCHVLLPSCTSLTDGKLTPILEGMPRHCPMCCEPIADAALKCRHCLSMLRGADIPDLCSRCRRGVEHRSSHSAHDRDDIDLATLVPLPIELQVGSAISVGDDLNTAINDMERFYDDREKNDRADRAFHVSIARATGNGALVDVLDHLWDQRGRLWSRMEHHFHTDALRAHAIADHRQILEAIVARDPAGARRAMRAHLERVTRQFARGWNSTVKGAQD